MTSDNDSDYSDAEDDVEVENIVTRDKQVNKDGLSVRGKDVNWVEVYRFATACEFHESEIGKKIADDFTVRKDREFDYEDVKILYIRNHNLRSKHSLNVYPNVSVTLIATVVSSLFLQSSPSLSH